MRRYAVLVVPPTRIGAGLRAVTTFGKVHPPTRVSAHAVRRYIRHSGVSREASPLQKVGHEGPRLALMSAEAVIRAGQDDAFEPSGYGRMLAK